MEKKIKLQLFTRRDLKHVGRVDGISLLRKLTLHCCTYTANEFIVNLQEYRRYCRCINECQFNSTYIFFLHFPRGNRLGIDLIG